MSLPPLSHHCHTCHPPRGSHRRRGRANPRNRWERSMRAAGQVAVSRRLRPSTLTDEGTARANRTVPTPICFRSP